jgi:hypothetical protein
MGYLSRICFNHYCACVVVLSLANNFPRRFIFRPPHKPRMPQVTIGRPFGELDLRDQPMSHRQIEHPVVFHIKGKPSAKSAGRQSVTTLVTPGTLLITHTSSSSDTERAKTPSTWTSPFSARTVTPKS